jgi:hypothetical protein
MPGPLLAAAPYVLSGLSALGGIFGRKKKKRRYLDPAMYRQLYGEKAVGERTQSLVNQILSSPYGQTLMQGAAEQGQSLQNQLNRSAAAAGFGPEGGAQSGASDFGIAAGPAAVGSLQRGVRSGLWANAMPLAQGMVDREGALHLSNLAAQNEEPQEMNLLGQLGQAASVALPGTALAGGGADWQKLLASLSRRGRGGVPAGSTMGSPGWSYPMATPVR